ncbi:hypothetical protein LWI29_009391 [Acer saccharum]|uniref:Uncharacterized protein n=1 Tax=Acer saccharum TaxID=4024 RepID=A0AA39W285_ACESA|nr:hypothetical protein LWI29_009391 [Acer saccharum]
MDPSLRSSLFNRMMQAMELGDKSTADKIESLIHNFRPDSPVPISVYVPSSEDDFIPNICPPSSNSDSPTMPRSSNPGGSKRRAPRASRESLLDAQTTVDSDIEDHQRDALHFSLDRPCSFDTEVNVVGEDELRKYKSSFDIPDSVTLMLPGDRAVWNPPENVVAIYGAMLSCGVTLPLQPFIARFLAEAQIAPAQLAPNSYRILMCLCLMWKLKGYGPPTPREICHFYTLRQAGNGGMSFLLSSPVENWIPEGVANPGQVEVSSDEKKKAVKNSEAASKRHAAGLAKEGIASPDGDDHSDGEEAGDVSRGGAESGRPPMHAEVAANTPAATIAATIPAAATPSRKGKEKVGASGGVGDVDGGRVESGPSPVRPKVAASTPAATATTPAASTAVTFPAATAPNRKGKEKVGVSGVAIEIPIFDVNVPETPPDPSSNLTPRTGRGKRSAEGTPDHIAQPLKRASRVMQYVVSSDEEVVEEPVLAEAPSAETAVLEASVERPDLAESPLPEVVNQFGASTIPQTSATPPPVAADEPDTSFVGQPRSSGRKEPTDKPGSSRQAGATASGSGVAHEAPPIDPTEVGEGVEFISLSDFTAAEICSHIMNNNVYVDGNLSAQLAAEEKLNTAEKEIRLLREQLSANQESLAARFEAERLAEEAKEKAEREALDLRNQLSSHEVILNDLKAVLEVEAVDRFKRSPAYDALLLREFEKGMRQARKFFAMKDHSNEKALRRFDKSLQQHMGSGVGLIKEQIKRWKAHYRYNRTETHPMHLEIPSKRAFNTYYSGQKGSFSGSGAEPDLGPVAERDYEPFMPEGDKEVTWPSEEEFEDEEDSKGPPAAN